MFLRTGQALPPSVRRIDLVAFAGKGVAWGLLAFIAALIALWRPIMGRPAPQGALIDHAIRVGACALQELFPSILGDVAEAYRAYLRGLGSDEVRALRYRLWLAGLAAFMCLAASAWLHLRPRDGLLFLRGSMRFSGEAAVNQLRKRLKDRVEARPDHALAPGVPYPADLWTRHVLLVGGTGAGKSTILKPLLSKIIKADEHLLLFDPKGDFTKAFSEPILLAPWDVRTSAWDVAADIRNIGAARRFAAAIVKEGTDPMWSNAARQVLVGSIKMLRAEHGDAWGWRELADTLSMPQAQLLHIMRIHHQEAVRAVERASVTTQGVLINLSAFCSSIHDLADAWGHVRPEHRISFVSWLTKPRRSPRQIILQGNGSYPEISRGYVEGIFSVLGGLVNSVEMDDDPKRKVWIVLDELPQCGKIPILPLFSVGRSRGVRCVAACQDLSQLEEVHGRESVRSLVSMTGSILVGQMSQGDTAESLAKALGSREVERRNESHSFGRDGSQSVSFAREDLALYKPSELGSRLGLDPKRNGVVLALALEGNAYELFWPFHKSPGRRRAHIPSRWAQGRPDDSSETHPFNMDLGPLAATVAEQVAADASDGSCALFGPANGSEQAFDDSAWLTAEDASAFELFEDATAGDDSTSLHESGR